MTSRVPSAVPEFRQRPGCSICGPCWRLPLPVCLGGGPVAEWIQLFAQLSFSHDVDVCFELIAVALDCLITGVCEGYGFWPNSFGLDVGF